MQDNQELRFWLRTHRTLHWFVALALLGFLLGPSAEEVFANLLGFASHRLGLAWPIARHALAVLVASAGAIVVARLVAASETRPSAALLAGAAVLAALAAFYSALRLLRLIEPFTGFSLPPPLALPLPAAAARGAELLLYLAAASGLGGIGFVPRRWLVLGAPAIVAATAAQVGLLIQSCTGDVHPLCAAVHSPTHSFGRVLPAATAILLVLAWLLLFGMAVEIIRSIRKVALEEGQSHLAPSAPGRPGRPPLVNHDPPQRAQARSAGAS